MVSAILLLYVIDDRLPTRGTFDDPGSNPGADNFFSFVLFFFPHMLSSFFLHKWLFYLVCTVGKKKAPYDPSTTSGCRAKKIIKTTLLRVS